MTPELVVALVFGVLGTALALAAIFHSHWVHLRTFGFLRRSHMEVMAHKSGDNAPLSGGHISGYISGGHISNQEFIAKAMHDHNRIYNYIKGQRTQPTIVTWV